MKLKDLHSSHLWQYTPGTDRSWWTPGQQPLSADNKKVLWNALENGYQAFEFLVNLAKKDKVGENFFTDDSTAFTMESSSYWGGSYRLSGLTKAKAPNLNYGVTTLPTYNGVAKTFGSYWQMLLQQMLQERN